VHQVIETEQQAFTEYEFIYTYSGGEYGSWTMEVVPSTTYRTVTTTHTERGDGGWDAVAFAPGIEPGQVWLRRDGPDVVLGISAPGVTSAPFDTLVDSVRMRDWSTAATRIDRVEFADGTRIDLTAFEKWAGVEAINLARGNGVIDVLSGSGADDTVLFRRGDGADVFTGNDSPDTTDRVVLGTGIESADVWLARRNDDLELSLVRTTDRLTFRGWYASASAQVDEIRAADGSALLASRVEQLRQAMAAFDPPTGIGIELSPEAEAALAPVLAASWQRPPGPS
jgi:hypothetical protein